MMGWATISHVHQNSHGVDRVTHGNELDIKTQRTTDDLVMDFRWPCRFQIHPWNSLGHPWGIWEYLWNPLNLPTRTVAAEALCQDCNGQRGASTVENEP